MFFKKYKIKSWLRYTVYAGAFSVLVGFVEKRQQERVCKDINVHIDNQLENHFINQQDVLSLIAAGQGEYVRGKEAGELELRELEQRLYRNRFVERAQVSRSLTGNLIVDIKQARPIARIINRQGEDLYISSTGKLLPVSERYTARVLLLEGGSVHQLFQQEAGLNKEGQALFGLLNFIYEHKFWKAQIAFLQLNSKFEIKMFPQIGKQVIEFGKPENLQSKFNRLMVFYKEILPAKGWNSYDRVSLKYQNQIICE